MTTKALTIETAKVVIKTQGKDNFTVTYCKNPCFIANSKLVDEYEYLVLFNYLPNPLSSVWGYTKTKEKAEEIIRAIS